MLFSVLGGAGRFRRSERTGLGVEHVTFVDGGLIVTVASSQTDQEGRSVGAGISCGSGLTIGWSVHDRLGRGGYAAKLRRVGCE